MQAGAASETGSTTPSPAPSQSTFSTSSTPASSAAATQLISQTTHTPGEPGGKESPNAPTKQAWRIEGNPPQTLAEVIRFDITVPWVVERWPRVTAGLSALNLHGYRVPLVTGTGQSDLAGALTYYFDKNQKLERIIFHGTSGDPRPLVTLVTAEPFNLERVVVNDPGLAFYQRKSSSSSLSELHIRPARVLRADTPNKRYEIEMALRRP